MSRRPRILLLGAAGQVGRELQRALLPLGDVTPVTRAQADLSQPQQLSPILSDLKPRWVVNAAAYTAVDKAEGDEAAADALNHRLPAFLAERSARDGFRLVHYSTDYVFDGRADRPYREDDATAPQGVYGRTKLAGEQAALRAPDALVLRLSWVFGQHGGNFPKTMIRLARERQQLRVVADQHGCPTPAALAADLTLLALHQGVTGLHHCCAAGATTWHAFAQAVLQAAWDAGLAGLQARPQDVAAIATADFPTPARRPAWSVMGTTRLEQALGLSMPPWQPYVDQLVRHLKESGA